MSNRPYSQRHLRLSPEPLARMVDSAAFTSFIQPHLQQIGDAVLTGRSNTERIDQLQAQLNTVEDKLLNISRLFKLHPEALETPATLLQLESRVQALEALPAAKIPPAKASPALPAMPAKLPQLPWKTRSSNN